MRAETLAAHLGSGVLPIAKAVRIASEIGEALERAHSEGTVYGEVTTANVVLSPEGGVTLLGRAGSGEGHRETDPRADIFSLGVVLYEMLAGTTPGVEPVSLRRYRDDVPELLEHVVRKMLAKRPEERYQLVHEVLTDLAHVVVDEAEPRDEGITRAARSWSRRWLGAGLVVVLGGLGVWWLALSRGPPAGRELTSVAVLPLRNLSKDPLESDYLAEGISQAVITKLTQTGLRVTPWETARRYGDTTESAGQIARALNVDAILAGTFQLVDERILTTLSLVEAESGLQTWADEFEEPVESIFGVQRRIAMGAAESLNIKLTGAEEEALARPQSRSVEAYDFLLQGVHALRQESQEAVDIAFDYFLKAIELDETLAEAHLGLGAVHTTRYLYGWGEGRHGLEQGKASYERALQMRPSLMGARRGLVQVYFWQGLGEACLIQGELAARYGKERDVETMLTRAEAYSYGGLTELALPLYRAVLQFDPLHQEAHFQLALSSFWTGSYRDTVEVGESYLRQFGDEPEIRSVMAPAYQALGNIERARLHHQIGIEASAPVEFALFFGGFFYNQLGERERALEAWRRGVAQVNHKLEAFPNNARMRGMLACFLGLAGQQESFTTEAERALATTELSGFELYPLATTFAALGQEERAVEVLRRAVRQGRILPVWKSMLDAASVVLSSEAFDQFLTEYEAEKRRLLVKYASLDGGR